MAGTLKKLLLSDIPEMKIHGRTACDKEGNPELNPLALFWAGSGVELNVAASELWMSLESDCSLFEPWILILINNSVISRMMLPPGEHRICVFRNFDPAEVHNVRIIKDTQAMSEDQAHSLVVKGIEVSEDCRFLPLPEKKLRIEFIGDSITSGEGLAGAKKEMKWISPWMSMQGNYAFLIADKLKADIRILSQGGWGVHWSWLGNTDCAMPGYYEQVCGLAGGEKNVRLGAIQKNRFDLWPPDCVVVSLGTNDASGCLKLAEDAGMRGTYREEDLRAISDSVKEFLLIIRKNNKNAFILWVYGMIGKEIQPAIEDGIADYMMMSGDKRVALKILPAMSANEAGSRNHPGPLVHKKAADIIADELKYLLRL
ncbi:MAG: hypothetical protein K5930_00930 [Treponemataceae bacterium]|nr:hypothetical protein [Treponemataceae bacterium]